MVAIWCYKVRVQALAQKGENDEIDSIDSAASGVVRPIRIRGADQPSE
jgi:hypothetical protein